jgi:gamma-glutamyltranspeptidase/glutathione hydrolase
MIVGLHALGRSAIASHSPLASSIALKIIEGEGNAIDAAVAASLLLNALEPGWSGLGGGGFALVYSEDTGLRALDYRETAPLRVRPEEYRREDDLSIGYRAVAAPGTLKGLWILHQELGEMRWSRIIEAVMEYVRRCRVSRLWSTCMRANLDRALDKLRVCPESCATFLKDGWVYPEGSEITFPRLLETLKMIRDDVDYFYGGEFADEVDKVFSSNNGFLSSADLSHYSPVWRRPITCELDLGGRELKLAAMPPPGSGVLVAEALKILSRMCFDASSYYPELARLLFHIIDERCSLICDPSFNDVDVGRLLSDDHVERALRFIEEDRITYHPARDSGGTSQVSIADAESRTYVSLTETIECFMGSGITVHGVLLNDEMHDFTLQSGHPNSISPGKRPASSMSPLIILDKDDTPSIIIGASGGMRIISSMIQVLSNHLLRGMDPISSILEGRIHVRGDRVILEDLVDDVASDAFSSAGLRLGKIREASMHPGTDIYFGAVQAIFRKDSLFLAVSDPRKQPGAAAR